ncbi:MAG: hypothetical protein A3H28_14690 [Acidobacteria bacterium RIFCSPLOWO2_02_FULL_61_28]|nr:MAG: hypothetical protein A3H28_14690 [Acidobacteria bacterium RIFCSPLOWO2_02_FULL_61_28]
MPRLIANVRPNPQPMRKLPNHLAEWLALGYSKKMASAEFLAPPPAEFIRVYHFTSSQHGQAAVRLKRLKVARFGDANDPFELLALNRHDRAIRHLAAQLRDDYNDKKGLLCFTRNWASPLLWSHYGDRHKGVCLGFDVRRSLVSEIDYADKPLRRRLPDDPETSAIDDGLLDLLARTKSHHWKYEEELRLFIELASAVTVSPLFFRPFDEELMLREVILGHRCDLDLQTVRTGVGETVPNAVAFKARLAFRSFEVRLNGKTRPDVSNGSA